MGLSKVLLQSGLDGEGDNLRARRWKTIYGPKPGQLLVGPQETRFLVHLLPSTQNNIPGNTMMTTSKACQLGGLVGNKKKEEQVGGLAIPSKAYRPKQNGYKRELVGN
jgi:hypothetical protein